MCRQGRIRLSAPTTPRGRERLRSSVSKKKRRETTIKPPRTSQRQRLRPRRLLRCSSTDRSEIPIGRFSSLRNQRRRTNQTKLTNSKSKISDTGYEKQRRMQRYSRRNDGINDADDRVEGFSRCVEHDLRGTRTSNDSSDRYRRVLNTLHRFGHPFRRYRCLESETGRGS